MATTRGDSKKDWGSSGIIEHINAGSLQRIADAVEKMAVNYDHLRNERDSYKRLYEEEKDKVRRLTKSNERLYRQTQKLKTESSK